MSHKLTIELLQGDQIPGIASDWDLLYRADTRSNVFLSRKFLEPILLSDANTHLLTVRRGPTLVGLLPILVTTVWDRSREVFRTDLKMAGTVGWADYNGFLLNEDLAADVLTSIAGYLQAQNWGRIRFKNLRMDREHQSHFFSQFSDRTFGVSMQKRVINDGATNNLLCPAISLPSDFDTYLDGLSKNTRQKLRRFLRKVADGEFVVRTGTPEDLPQFQSLWMKQWPRKSSLEKRAAKYASILATGFEEDALQMSVLEDVAGTTLGIVASFDDPERRAVRFFVSARDPAATSAPVNLILHADAIRRAIERGYHTYDFLRGDEPYKFSLGAKSVEISYPVLRRRSIVPDSKFLSKLSTASLVETLSSLMDREEFERATSASKQLSDLWKQ